MQWQNYVSLSVFMFHEALNLADSIFVWFLVEGLQMHLVYLFIEYSLEILSFSCFIGFTDKNEKTIKEQI